jgi:hypothetical protein
MTGVPDIGQDGTNDPAICNPVPYLWITYLPLDNLLTCVRTMYVYITACVPACQPTYYILLPNYPPTYLHVYWITHGVSLSLRGGGVPSRRQLATQWIDLLSEKEAENI